MEVEIKVDVRPASEAWEGSSRLPTDISQDNKNPDDYSTELPE